MIPPDIDESFGRNDTIDIVAGRHHTCMLLKGRVRCWGDRDTNGYGVSVGRFRTPGSLSENLSFEEKEEMIEQITAGLRHTCVRFADSSVRCWGENSLGQLGLGNTADIALTSQTTTDIEFGFSEMNEAIKHIDAGDTHTCALSTANNIYCWGEGANQRLGNGSTMNIGDTEMTATIPPIGIMPTPMETFMGVAAGGNHTCAYLSNNDVICWGDPLELGVNAPITSRVGTISPASITAMDSSLNNLSIQSMVSGFGVTCVLTDENKALCWGVGAGGQMGYGCDEVTHLVGSTNFINVMNPAKDDAFGLPYGDQQPITEPVPMDAMEDTDTNCRSATDVISYQNYTDIEQIVVGPGSLHSCVLRSSGMVYCFGINTGVHNDTEPIEEVDPDFAVEVSCERPSMMETSTYPGGSPLGYDRSLLSSLLPDPVYNIVVATNDLPVALEGRAVRIASGEAHTCALLENDQIKCWGANCDGQLGYGPSLDVDATGGGPGNFTSISSYGTFDFPFR